MMFGNMALLVMVVLQLLQAVTTAPSHLSEPELLAGIEPCRCVDIRLCSTALRILKRVSSSYHGPNLVELNLLKHSTCGFRGFMPFVCCPLTTSFESRIHHTPNILGRVRNERLNKKSYIPDYSTDYPERSSEHRHQSYAPSSSTNSDVFSEYDSSYYAESKPLSVDDREDNPDFENNWSSYDEDEDEDDYPSEEDLEMPSNTHFANHPPHVHKQVPNFSLISKVPFGHSQEKERPHKKNPKHVPESKPSPTQCRTGTGAVDVSVFSRGGPQKLQKPIALCEERGDSHDKPINVTTTSQILLDIQKASSSPGVQLLPGAQCGVTVDERIVGGKEAELGAFPWVARIGYIRNVSHEGPYLFRCGGSLLNERYVLTAAHCVVNLPGGLKLALIRLGEHDDRTNPDCKTPDPSTCAEPVQDYRPQNVTVHPLYDQPKYSNDLALIRLDRPVRLSTYVSPICLPLGELGTKNYTGLKATVAGWGSTHPGIASNSPVLQWVRLAVVDAHQCAKAYEPADAKVDAWLQLCAGGESNRDSCDGDSGGPLMRPEQPTPDSLPRYFLVGVVSFGAKICGTVNMPGVYTRVAAYLGWILDSLKR